MSKLLLPPILLLSAVATATAPKKLGIFDQLSLIGQATGTAGATQTVANAGAGISFRVGGVSALVSLQPSDALILSDRRSSSLWRNLLSPSSSQSSYYLDIRYSPWNDWAATTFLRNLGFRARANVSVVKWKIPDETDKTGAVLLQGPASSDIYNILLSIQAVYYLDITALAGIDREKFDLGLSVDLPFAWHHMDGDTSFVSAQMRANSESGFRQDLVAFEPTVALWINQIRASFTMSINNGRDNPIGGVRVIAGLGVRGELLDLIKITTN